MDQRIGVVLSGGGHRGAAHAGMLKAMEEFNLEPDVISGSSAGAIVGAIYAAGHSPETILDIFKNIKLFSFSFYARRKAGIIDSERFEDILKPYFTSNSFENLQKTLLITTTNIVKGEVRVFEKGPLIPSILASAALPGIFTPIPIEDSLYSDGGVLDNFPVSPLLGKSLDIYGSYVCPLKKLSVKDFKHSYNVIDRAVNLMMHNTSVQKFELCKMVFSPDSLEEFGLFKTGQADRIFQIGYDHASKKLAAQKM
ncbi:patatin-like phospholipase family protein [Dokdonia sp. Hel_I_53]|uniref:patatin-like phospholipase family protein n=1 Tax=Dokdonia sp. Hel_I_53 TaxID=1566287 RepID=UPI001198E61D|nr:patatin-like phospholipase family protein [Dokdonia sp. Hel_I_53]TVZ53125.1 NTE family protein [Dokdonia sp. Hel_I_53]